MSYIWLILCIAGGVYTLRMAGLLLPRIALPERWEESLQFLPVAMLTALVMLSLTGSAGGDASRLPAAGVGGLVAWKTRKMWACIAAGMLSYWLLQLVVR